MRNIHRELQKTPEAYIFNAECPLPMYKDLTAFTLSRLEQILSGSETFTSEEAWLIRRDLCSLMETLVSTTGAHHSQFFYQGGSANDTTSLKEEFFDISRV